MFARECARAGAKLHTIDAGGGWPILYGDEKSEMQSHAVFGKALIEGVQRGGADMLGLTLQVEPGRDVKQVWFPGVHCDVGGGYVETGLSDGALKWMVDEAIALDLGLDEQLTGQIKPDARGLLHNSLDGVFKHLPVEVLPSIAGPKFVPSSIKITKPLGTKGRVPVQFTGTLEDLVNEPRTVTINFGDGATAACVVSGLSFSCKHDYALPTPALFKTYNFELTATNGKGTLDTYKSTVRIP